MPGHNIYCIYKQNKINSTIFSRKSIE